MNKKKIILFIAIPVLIIAIVLTLVFTLNNKKDTRTELLAESFDHKNSISFGRYDDLKLTYDGSSGINLERVYECSNEDNLNKIKEEIKKKAYYLPKNSDNHLVFYDNGYFYGAYFKIYKYINEPEITYEIFLYPFCSYINGLTPFFLGKGDNLFKSGESWSTVGNELIYDYSRLKETKNDNLCFNSLDIYTKEDIYNFFTKINSTYCKIEDENIYLKSTSYIHYNRDDYSLKIELYDDYLKIIDL